MDSPFIIGLAGGSAAGKTFLLNQLRQRFTASELAILSMDNYYKPLENQEKDENGFVNFDIPTAINDAEFLLAVQALKEGRSISKMEYTFNSPEIIPAIIAIQSAPIILVEGIFVLYFEELKRMLNLTVFVDAKEELKLQRRLKRDENERSIIPTEIHYQWHNHVIPGYKKYLLPYKEEADIVLNNNHHSDVAIEVLSSIISSRLPCRP